MNYSSYLDNIVLHEKIENDDNTVSGGMPISKMSNDDKILESPKIENLIIPMGLIFKKYTKTPNIKNENKIEGGSQNSEINLIKEIEEELFNKLFKNISEKYPNKKLTKNIYRKTKKIT